MTPANCLEAAPSDALPRSQPVVDLGLGMFLLHEIQRVRLLHSAVPLFSRGKREDQMLRKIYLCVVIVACLWAGVVKRLGFSKHRS